MLCIPVSGEFPLVVLWGAYGFRYAASPGPGSPVAIPWDQLRPESPVLAAAIDRARDWRVLPEPYLWGFARFFKHVQARPAFVLGQRLDHGVWYFFPLTFALKTPLGLLGLLALAAATWRRLESRPGLFLLVPVALYVAVSMRQGINIGHRHLLPIYPFLFVIASRAAGWAAQQWPRRAPAALVVALAAWTAGAALWVRPHFLAYFNEASGGPGRAWRLLADSSLDWG